MDLQDLREKFPEGPERELGTLAVKKLEEVAPDVLLLGQKAVKDALAGWKNGVEATRITLAFSGLGFEERRRLRKANSREAWKARLEREAAANRVIEAFLTLGEEGIKVALRLLMA